MNKKIRKLTLSKETIKNLDDLGNVVAGVTPTDLTVYCSACTRACSECCTPNNQTWAYTCPC
jgi:hypothetical protein